MLAVLRPPDIFQARQQLAQLSATGLRHVELAVSATDTWVQMVSQLCAEFPQLSLGAASVRHSSHLEAALAAGLAYAVSPILDETLLRAAAKAGVALVPGVFTPTEVHQACSWGAPLVKLFPASALGCGYWKSLVGPLGPLPFCIAAGGLTVPDIIPWLRSGVDAVALGASLFDHQSSGSPLTPGLATALATLPIQP